jgi:hypothetical protein
VSGIRESMIRELTYLGGMFVGSMANEGFFSLKQKGICFVWDTFLSHEKEKMGSVS